MQVDKNLSNFKTKYYLNALIKGGIFVVGSLLSFYLLLVAIEYVGNLSSFVRTSIFFVYIASAIAVFALWIGLPLYKFVNQKHTISDITAAHIIGDKIPGVTDRLVNYLQLRHLTTSSSLAQASLEQKEVAIRHIDFREAIDLSENKRYLKFILLPTAIVIAALLLVPQVLTSSTTRLLQYDKEFIPEAPFSFDINKSSLKAYKNDDLTIEVNIEGDAIPDAVYLITASGKKIRMKKGLTTTFEYEIKQIQQGFEFHFEASGYRSQLDYHVNVVPRPLLNSFNVKLEYPPYTHKKDEILENTGNIVAPQGTNFTWSFDTESADSLILSFEETRHGANRNDGRFSFSKKILQSVKYTVALKNEHTANKTPIEYMVSITPDQRPSISFNEHRDTTLYDNLFVGGNISDDYGLTALRFSYRIIPEQGEPASSASFTSIPIDFNPSLTSQSYFHKVALSGLNIQKGETLEYYIEVWDNDAVNGRKSSRTGTYRMSMPSFKELKNKISTESNQAEEKMDEAIKDAKDLNKDVKDIQDRLKGKKKLDWQDKKMIKDLSQKREALEKEVEELQKQTDALKEKQEKLNPENKALQEKAEQLQKLMDELLDEETKKLYEELNKLMEQNIVKDEMQKALDQVEFKQENLEKELDRALELFKKLKFESKLDATKNELEQLAKDQEELAEKTKEAKKSELDEIKKEQDYLNKEFEELKKEFEELEKMNEELAQKKDMEQLDQPMEDIEEELKKSADQLDNQKKKQASESQKKSSEKMQEMAQKMDEMMQSAEMDQLSENYEDLRQILENLLKLSFDQEELMKEFRTIKRVDPKFVKLSQQQLKLRDDAKYIEDSLVSLSKRVFQIESFVTREVAEMNSFMDQSLEEIKKRLPEQAAAKQQFTMTSINNLALLLNDILKQMQEQMQQQSMGGQQKNMQKPQQGNSPKMSDLQKQLNQKIKNLKKSGKQGKALSQELAKLAAEQEMIRNAMKDGSSGQGGMSGGKGGKGKSGQASDGSGGEQNRPGKKGGKKGEKGEGGNEGVQKLMEESEEELVNKRLSDELIKRQEQILTRLLESEKAQRERDLDEKREAKSAKQFDREVPENLSDYLKTKEQQVELLKTVPPTLSPYYKKQVNEYFKNLNEAP